MILTHVCSNGTTVSIVFWGVENGFAVRLCFGCSIFGKGQSRKLPATLRKPRKSTTKPTKPNQKPYNNLKKNRLTKKKTRKPPETSQLPLKRHVSRLTALCRSFGRRSSPNQSVVGAGAISSGQTWDESCTLGGCVAFFLGRWIGFGVMFFWYVFLTRLYGLKWFQHVSVLFLNVCFKVLCCFSMVFMGVFCMSGAQELFWMHVDRFLTVVQ